MNWSNKLIIDRKKWLRGEGPLPSFLFREADGKQCCVGIYCSTNGIPDEKLLKIRVAPALVDCAIPKWLLAIADLGEVASTIDRLYACNDTFAYVLKGDEHEAAISKLFAEQGVEVTFID